MKDKLFDIPVDVSKLASYREEILDREIVIEYNNEEALLERALMLRELLMDSNDEENLSIINNFIRRV